MNQEKKRKGNEREKDPPRSGESLQELKIIANDIKTLSVASRGNASSLPLS
jgi:hypothetical protein